MIDSHCHLHLCSENQVTLLERAANSGVHAVVQVSTDMTTHQWGVDFLNDNPQLPVQLVLSAGLYPSQAKSNWRQQIPLLRSSCEKEEIVAIGEVGIDQYHDDSYLPQQIEMLRCQIELALEYNLPLIVHCRKAYDPLVHIIDQYPKLRGVWHCFEGTYEQAMAFVDRGFIISLSGLAALNKGKKFQSDIARLPRDAMIIETDSPYLTPPAKKGKRNEPAYVRYLFEYLHTTWQEDPVKLETMFDATTRSLFNLKEVS